MPAFIIAEKCDGCKGRDRTACMYACPNDLMVLDKVTMKAYNRDPWMCWECLCCAKICPQQAIDLRGYADFVPLGASAMTLRRAGSAWPSCQRMASSMLAARPSCISAIGPFCSA